MRRITHCVTYAFLTIPSKKDWLYAVSLLLIYVLIYLPIGLKLRFLEFNHSSWQTAISVAAGAFVMPELVKELGFRVLLIPHLTEAGSAVTRWFWSGFSWIAFMVYHLHPFTPPFFRTPAFLIGAGLIGID